MEVIKSLVANMDISDWITLAAVLVALGLGVSSLIQTQSLQKRERKERLLNEIIEWATSIADTIVTQSVQNTNSDKNKLFMYAHFESKSEYMVTIAKIADSSLVPYVERIIGFLKYGICTTAKSVEVEDAGFPVDFSWAQTTQEPPVPQELLQAGIKIPPKIDELLRTFAIILMKKVAEIKTR